MNSLLDVSHKRHILSKLMGVRARLQDSVENRENTCAFMRTFAYDVLGHAAHRFLSVKTCSERQSRRDMSQCLWSCSATLQCGFAGLAKRPPSVFSQQAVPFFIDSLIVLGGARGLVGQAICNAIFRNRRTLIATVSPHRYHNGSALTSQRHRAQHNIT